MCYKELEEECECECEDDGPVRRVPEPRSGILYLANLGVGGETCGSMVRGASYIRTSAVHKYRRLQFRPLISLDVGLCSTSAHNPVSTSP